jgi:hypothetical protein
MTSSGYGLLDVSIAYGVGSLKLIIYAKSP